MRVFGLEEGSDGFYKDTLGHGRLAGRIQGCFGGTTLCGVCSSHGKCKLLLSAKPRLGLNIMEVEEDVIGWLAAGLVCDPAQHEELSKTLRRDIYKMKLRS